MAVPAGVRPTEGKVREALSSIWAPRLAGARVLDLFAGSGAVGLELLSRGAASAVLVERAPAVLAALRRSLAQLDSPAVETRRLDLPRGAARLATASFDLIFADPPYAFADHARLLAAAAPLAAPTAQLAIEHPGELELSASGGWRAVDRRRYGDSALTFFDLDDLDDPGHEGGEHLL